MGRRTGYYLVRERPTGRYQRADDAAVLQQIRAVTNSRATYGYRRVWAMVNRTFRTGYNRKRIRRVMQLHGLMLPPRVHRQHGRPHLGQVQQPASNQRWCSEAFLIPCCSGEVISVAFAIDCHDREAVAWTASPRPLTGADIRTLMDRTLWARFGEATLQAPHAIQWLSDNGPQYTATASVLYAHELGLVPITTPASSPQSHGLAEAFAKTFKRDYVAGAELRDAETVLAHLGEWFDGARDAEPGGVPGGRHPKLLPVSSTMGSTPDLANTVGAFKSHFDSRRCETSSFRQLLRSDLKRRALGEFSGSCAAFCNLTHAKFPRVMAAQEEFQQA